MNLGINLDFVSYYSAEWTYADAMRQSNAWFSQPPAMNPFDDKRAVAVDPATGGLVLATGQVAAALVYRDVRGPVGLYHLTWKGKGKLEVQYQARKVAEADGVLVVELTPGTQGVLVRVLASDPADPVRDVQLRPEKEPAALFHTLFLDRLRGFDTVRLMNSGNTNFNKLITWADRPKPIDQTQAGPGGMCLEHMVALCNELGARPYYCFPIEADDTFVAGACAALKDAKREPYLELGNETWNGIFWTAQRASQLGKERGLAPDAGWYAASAFTAQRSMEVFRIAQDVFGGLNRFTRVIGTQVANVGVTKARLEYGEAYRYFDAVGIAPYFSRGGTPEEHAAAYTAPVIDAFLKQTKEVGWTATEIADMRAKGPVRWYLDAHGIKWGAQTPYIDLLTDIAGRSAGRKYLERIIEWAPLSASNKPVQETKALADRYGLGTVAYECGGDTTYPEPFRSQNDALVALSIAANRMPGMGEAYRRYFAELDRFLGGALVCHYKNVYPPNKAGQWGLLEYQDQPAWEAPKFQAITEAMS
jgi:hypothetical protein